MAGVFRRFLHDLAEEMLEHTAEFITVQFKSNDLSNGMLIDQSGSDGKGQKLVALLPPPGAMSDHHHTSYKPGHLIPLSELQKVKGFRIINSQNQVGGLMAPEGHLHDLIHDAFESASRRHAASGGVMSRDLNNSFMGEIARKMIRSEALSLNASSHEEESELRRNFDYLLHSLRDPQPSGIFMGCSVFVGGGEGRMPFWIVNERYLDGLHVRERSIRHEVVKFGNRMFTFAYSTEGRTLNPADSGAVCVADNFRSVNSDLIARAAQDYVKEHKDPDDLPTFHQILAGTFDALAGQLKGSASSEDTMAKLSDSQGLRRSAAEVRKLSAAPVVEQLKPNTTQAPYIEEV